MLVSRINFGMLLFLNRKSTDSNHRSMKYVNRGVVKRYEYFPSFGDRKNNSDASRATAANETVGGGNCYLFSMIVGTQQSDRHEWNCTKYRIEADRKVRSKQV